MVPLEQEKNIEVLREYSILITRENEELRAKLAKATEQVVENEWLSKDLKNKLSKIREKFFGFGREKLEPRDERPVGHRNEQLKLHGQRDHEEKPIKTKSEEKSEFSNIVEHEMTKEDLEIESKLRALEKGVDAWLRPKNFYQETCEITITERTYTKVIHRQRKYKLKDEYNTAGKEVIVTAPGPAKLKPGSQYSIDFALAVVSDKYEYHIPLERQRRKMEAQGLDVEVKTLYKLVNNVHEHMLCVVPKIKRDIQKDFCAVHLDETPWLIISEKKRGQMWAMSNRIGSFYQFEPTRSGAIAREMLKGYTGGVMTDALKAYDALGELPGIRKGLCWSHVRREFYEIIDDFPAAIEMVRMVDELFDVEGKAKTFEELRELRGTESKEIIRRMQDWLMKTRQEYLPGDAIIGAVNYCANHWVEFTAFLKDLSLPLSNNDAERALRHAVMGRKNFNGSKTINGADVAAVLYTVIESAKKSGLQPKEYMKYVIEERWHGRDPKSPNELSHEKFGKNTKVTFPARENWEI